ncbi:response regulator [Tichowtungia aerotolerans]|uniref:Response regulator n=1 Tax=Tichowtungia aerotolerans TaxID=2697043 RepID=A0A6P1M6F8_9BACT|nr:response regulator [Tichowtungia aerotolerans]QHI69602.1 response regulator [Tichowtungia aerotolerans]
MGYILIIDDDHAVQSVFTQFLKSLGYRTESADNGKDGLDQMLAETPDLIITDIMMPEMDGLELVTYIRNHNSELPIIAISGGMQTASMNFLPLAKRFGACKVFEKPVSLIQLREAIHELLNHTDEKADNS